MEDVPAASALRGVSGRAVGSKGVMVTHCIHADIVVNYHRLCFTCLIA